MLNSTHYKIIKPNQRFEIGTFRSFYIMLSNLFRLKDLIFQLFKRDLFALYKKSFIGSAWILFSPLAGIISWVFLHRANIIRPGDVTVPYPAYLLIGTLIWGLFMSIYSAVTFAMRNYRYLFLQIYFPHEVIIWAQILVKLAHFSLSFIFTIAILILFGIIPSWKIILFPFVTIPLLFCAVSLGLFVSIMSIVSFDFNKLITSIMGLMLFITPVIYSADVVENRWLKQIIYFNPMTYLVCSARDIILYGKLYCPSGFFIVSLISPILIIISWRIFNIAEDRIVERMI